MNTFYRISSVIVLISILIIAQLSANEGAETIAKDLPRLLGSTNEGTEFLMTFHPMKEEPDTEYPIKVYITSSVATKITIEIPAREVFLQRTTIPNGVIVVDLIAGQAQCYRKEADEPPQPQKVYKGNAIIIKSEAPIICYGVANTELLSEGYLAIPTKSLGKKYIVSSYNDPALDDGNQYLTSYTSIIGAYNKTEVNIKLGGSYGSYTPGKNRLEVGDTDSQLLNKGDVWLIGVQGDYNDLSGTTVSADKPVAVISGSYCAYVPIQMGACNYLIEQDIPMESWGRKYHVTPIINRQGSSVLRIFGSEVYTKIYKDGSEWTYVMSVGGAEGTGYVEKRLEQNVPTTISAQNSINITQFNTSQQDDWVDASAFQMALTPVEQYQKALIWCMPGTKAGTYFRNNYLNLIYKTTSEGQIPNDLEFGKVQNGVMKWSKLYTVVDNPGVKITDADVKDSRYYYYLTMQLDSVGVYAMRGNDPMAGYIYGYGDSLNSYGYPVSVSVNDITKADTQPPMPTYIMDCEGKIQGSVTDQPEDDDLLRSNMAYLSLNKVESYNYQNLEYDEGNFNPGETIFMDWRLTPIDLESDAKAVITFSDRAGNDTTITIVYQPAKFSTTDSMLDWDVMKISDASISKTIHFKNESLKAIVIDSIIILSSEKGRDWDYNGFKIDPSVYKANGGVLPGYAIQPGEELSFNVIFEPSSVGSDYNAGKNQFIDSIGIKANWSQDMSYYCYNKYLTALKALIGYPCITAGSLDFGEVLVEQTRTSGTAIFNHGASQLTITGYSYENGNTDGAYQLSLGAISPEKPLIISAGAAMNFTITFKPKEMKSYADKIIFECDAEKTCPEYDPILELNARGTNLLIEPVDDVTINMNSFADVPIKTNSTNPSALVLTPSTGNSQIISLDSLIITGSNNNYNLKLIPKEDKIGVLYVSIGADDGIRNGGADFKVTVIDAGAVDDNLTLDNALFISPNPANSSSVNIKYNLEYDCDVELTLYNSNGMMIKDLLNNYQTAGNQSYSLSIDEFSAGIYFVEFRACGMIGHKSFVIVK